MLFRPAYLILGLLAAVQAAPLDTSTSSEASKSHLDARKAPKTSNGAPQLAQQAAPRMPFLIFVRFSANPASRNIDVPVQVIDRLVVHFQSTLPVSREQIGFAAGSVWTHPGTQDPSDFEWFEVANPDNGWHPAHLD
ncbi:MAG: hypothetical protein NXY57DRAFT_970653 [Lentinula lateritia]|uniref:Uncharacterized protein n=1 Tax=Lentinula lateritia TaxID=40482 RepID=A0ABQ8W004_9AGAR|nr:MAG: hypothetical protein NXY57DRAFT_970653 [Lentinula lateritia]KAJ4500819.1 hypothetical protein C8R41DRAFT_862933 [Lentinula lateritia]